LGNTLLDVANTILLDWILLREGQWIVDLNSSFSMVPLAFGHERPSRWQGAFRVGGQLPTNKSHKCDASATLAWCINTTQCVDYTRPHLSCNESAFLPGVPPGWRFASGQQLAWLKDPMSRHALSRHVTKHALDSGLVEGCALRSALGGAGLEVQQALRSVVPATSELLFSIHARMGDGLTRTGTKHRFKNDKRATAGSIIKSIGKLVPLLHFINRTHHVCTVVVSDSRQIVADAVSLFKSRGLCALAMPGEPVHSGDTVTTHRNCTPPDCAMEAWELKLMVEWGLLSFSDTIFQVTGSTFSRSARQHGLLDEDLCHIGTPCNWKGGRGCRTTGRSFCQGFTNVWCAAEACAMLQNFSNVV